MKWWKVDICKDSCDKDGMILQDELFGFVRTVQIRITQKVSTMWFLDFSLPYSPKIQTFTSFDFNTGQWAKSRNWMVLTQSCMPSS